MSPTPSRMTPPAHNRLPCFATAKGEDRNMSAATVPVLDLSTTSADELTQALIDWSCVLVSGHGIPDDLQQEMADVSAEFFDLPEQEKDNVRSAGQGLWQGWVPIYRGDQDLVEPGAVPDLVEWFQVQEFESFSLWPEQPTRMRPVWLALFQSFRDLSTGLIDMIATALDLPPADIPAWTERPYCGLAANNYPSRDHAPLPGQARFSPHTDEDGITLVMSRKDTGGLEIRRPHTPEDDWRPVCIPPGVVFIQPGDLLARWTNRVIHANEHRVMYPSAAGALIPRRQSIIFYLDPARETTVTPAPSCVARTSEVLPPLHVGEYIMKSQEVHTSGNQQARLEDTKG
jgi:isopenicillin N synthase-like dioxygenase